MGDDGLEMSVLGRLLRSCAAKISMIFLKLGKLLYHNAVGMNLLFATWLAVLQPCCGNQFDLFRT